MKSEKPVTKSAAKSTSEAKALPATVRLDEEQMRAIAEILYDMKDSIEDMGANSQSQNMDEADRHAPSVVMRSVLAAFFIIIAIALVVGLVSSWNEVVAANNLLTAIVMAAFLGIVALSSLVIGLSIGTESSKTYIVSLFSAVVALVALGVALFR